MNYRIVKFDKTMLNLLPHMQQPFLQCLEMNVLAVLGCAKGGMEMLL